MALKRFFRQSFYAARHWAGRFWRPNTPATPGTPGEPCPLDLIARITLSMDFNACGAAFTRDGGYSPSLDLCTSGAALNLKARYGPSLDIEGSC